MANSEWAFGAAHKFTSFPGSPTSPSRRPCSLPFLAFLKPPFLTFLSFPRVTMPASLFTKDEKVLCFHHEILYDAKILEVRHRVPGDKKSPLEYRVHYKGWKNT